MQDLARTLAKRGHEVRVVCSRRGYASDSGATGDDEIDGVSVRRIAAFDLGRGTALGRIVDYASYMALAGLECLRPSWRPHVVLALTTPPYLGLLGRVVAGLRGAVHGQWLMDLYPDSIVADGLLGSQSIVTSSLAMLTRMQLRGAGAVVVLGDSMALRAERYLSPGAAATVVPMWSFTPAGSASPEAVAQVRAQRGWKADDLVLLYSGNMGRGHRFSEFLAAAGRLGAGGPVWAFAGDGYRRREVEAFRHSHPAARIEPLSYAPAERLVESLCAADVHLVSLEAAWQGVMVPSKLQGAFAVGRPVIFVGGPDNEAASWIEESGGGWLVGAGDVDGLLAAVNAARDPAERARRGAAAVAFARKHFDRDMNCGRIAEVLEGCVRQDDGHSRRR